MDFETLTVHAGVEPDPTTGAVMTPIYQTSTYSQSSPGEHKGYEYARVSNPTRTALQNAVAALEGGEHALAFASGMSAIDAVLNLLKQGDRVVTGNDLYGGTHRLMTQLASNRGVEFKFVPSHEPGAIEGAVNESTKLVWIETPSNPLLNLVDIRAAVESAKRVGALVAVDNTFATPVFQRPLELGADIAMHSITKYLNGHSDVLMGCLAMRSIELHERLKFIQKSIGAVPGPMDCFLTLRGIKTLAVRMERHSANAHKVATWLEGHGKVRKVIYPGLPSHPQHELAKRQMSGTSGIVTFYVDGGLDECRRFLESLRLFALAESLGGVESLADHPAIMTHASVPREIREKTGVTDDLVRLSVGIESAEDLIADLESALDAV